MALYVMNLILFKWQPVGNDVLILGLQIGEKSHWCSAALEKLEKWADTVFRDLSEEQKVMIFHASRNSKKSRLKRRTGEADWWPEAQI